MTDIKKLFSGVGVVIDEKINEPTRTPNSIQKIVSSLQENHIPLLKYQELPDELINNMEQKRGNLKTSEKQNVENSVIDFCQMLCYIPPIRGGGDFLEFWRQHPFR